MRKSLTMSLVSAAMLVVSGASVAHAQQNYRAVGVSGFMQDLDPNDGVDYSSDFEGTWTADFSVPAASGLTLISNTQSQGGSRTTYSGATISNLVLNRASGPLTVINAPTPARVIFWDRASFRGGTDYFDVVATIGSTTVTLSFAATRDGQTPPADLGWNQLFVRGTPNANTPDADGLPLAPDIVLIAQTYLNPGLSIDGQTPQMPGRGRYGGIVEGLFDPAQPPALGSCCASSGACGVTLASSCTGTAVWTSGGSCTPNPCPQPSGACCDALLACSLTTNDDCSNIGNLYQGDNTVCSPQICAPPTVSIAVGVVGSGTITSTPAGISCGQANVNCDFEFDVGISVDLLATPAPGWEFVAWTSDVCSGNGTCTFTADDNYVFTATFRCKSDFDGVNGLSVQDIFAFLNAWFAGQLAADFNGVGGLSVQDIFDFLNAWFAGC